MSGHAHSMSESDDVMSEIFDENILYDGIDNDSVAITEAPSSPVAVNEPPPSYEQLAQSVKELKARLNRRNRVLEDVRVAYLKDVVTIKHWIHNILNESEKQELFRQVEQNLPSVDLTEPLILHAPKDAEFRVKPCESCGGRMDIVINDNALVAKLKNQLTAQRELEESFRLQVATSEALVEKLTKESTESRRSHEEEKRFMFTEMRRVKEAAEKINADNAHIKSENNKWREKEASARREIEDLKREVSRLSDFESKYYQIQQECSGLRGIIREKESQEMAHKLESDRLRKEIEDLTHDRTLLREEVKEISAELQESKDKLLRTKETVESLERSLDIKGKALLTVEMQFSDVKEELAALKESSAAELENMEKLCDQIRDECKAVEAKLKVSKRETAQVSEELRATQKTVEAQEKLLLDREDEIFDLAGDCESLEEEIEALKQFLQSSVGGMPLPSFQRERPSRERYYEEDDDSESVGSLDDGDGAGSGYESTSSNKPLKKDSNPIQTSVTSSDSFSPSESKANSSNVVKGSNSNVVKSTDAKVIDQEIASAPKTQSNVSDISIAIANTSESTDNIDDNIAKNVASGVSVVNETASSGPIESENASELVISPEGSPKVGAPKNSDVGPSPIQSPSGATRKSMKGENGGKSKREAVAKKSRGRRSTRVESSEARVSIRGGRALPPSREQDNSALGAGFDMEPADKYSNEDNHIQAASLSPVPFTITENEDESRTHTNTNSGVYAAENHDNSKRPSKSSTRVQAPSPVVTSEKVNISEPVEETKTSASVESNQSSSTRRGAVVNPVVMKDEKKTHAKAKSKTHAAMPTEIMVELDPPPAGASPEERAFRDMLLPLLAFTLGPNASKRAVNSMSHVIHEQFKVQMSSMKSLWEALLLLKRSLDFYTKMKIVMDGMLSISEKKNAITGAEVASIITEIVPIAGNILGTKVTPIWREICKLEESLVQFLIPNVDPTTGEFIYFHSEDYLKANKNDLKKSTEELARAVTVVFDYTDDSLTALNERLINLIRDWSFAKTEISQIDSKLEQQQSKLTSDFNVIIAGLNRDIQNMTSKYEMARAASKQLETKCDDFAMQIARLEKFQGMYEKLERETKSFREDKETLKKQLIEAKDEISSFQAKLKAKTTEFETIKMTLKNTEDALAIEAQKNVDWEVNYHQLSEEKRKLEKEIHDMIEKETERLRNMKAVSTQVEVIMSNSDTQTDYLIPAMTLKPLVSVVKGSHTKSIQMYPAVKGSHPLEEYTRQRVLENEEMKQLIDLNNMNFKMQKHTLGSDLDDDISDFQEDSNECALNSLRTSVNELNELHMNSPGGGKEVPGGGTSLEYSHHSSDMKNKEKLIYKSLIKAQKRLLFSKSRGEASELLDPVIANRLLVNNNGDPQKHLLMSNSLSELNKLEFFDKDLNPNIGGSNGENNSSINNRLTAKLSLELPSISKLGSFADDQSRHSQELSARSEDSISPRLYTKQKPQSHQQIPSKLLRKHSLDSLSINDSESDFKLTYQADPDSPIPKEELSALIKVDKKISDSFYSDRQDSPSNKSKSSVKSSKLQSSSQTLPPGYVDKLNFVVGGSNPMTQRPNQTRQPSVPFFQDKFVQQMQSSVDGGSTVKSASRKSANLISELQKEYFSLKK